MAPTVGGEKTYEMLWDCKYCSQRKNLGLTHRCCPACGAPQDPAARYFPSDAEKVAVQDHPYAGADVICPACKAAIGRACKCCSQCGSPLTSAAQVRLVGEPMPAAPMKKMKMGWIVLPLLGIVAVLAVGLFLLLRTRAGSFVVADKTWERSIDVEQLSMDHGSTWCDSLPSGAHALDRHREQRSTKQIPDGQNCVTTRKDQGNGTFKEVQECTPKYKSEPVMDDKCDYEAETWRTERTAKAHGSATDAPSWPSTSITRAGCTSLGCEREGHRSETYDVLVTEPKSGEKTTCTFDSSKWGGFSVGASYDGKIGAVTGHIECDSLKASSH
jgi:hypothetical protein